MYVHCWFSTKRRRWALVGDVQVVAVQALREAADRHGIELLEIGCMVDHVHLLIKIPAIGKLPSVMHLLKGGSARKVFQVMPELKLDLNTENLWQAGYGHKIVAPSSLPAVVKYIRTQEDRPEKYAR